jgi:hypothetical protein
MVEDLRPGGNTGIYVREFPYRIQTAGELTTNLDESYASLRIDFSSW